MSLTVAPALVLLPPLSAFYAGRNKLLRYLQAAPNSFKTDCALVPLSPPQSRRSRCVGSIGTYGHPLQMGTCSKVRMPVHAEAMPC
ncbi:hypothetical protein PsYK624_063110 [Phanerochaete sordida]|uniref:Secreted protein n=1 Tax=Phanerochaete sordida TaxID=48140 RepID=A0A9P3G938_9APHY|nr:hypothetical protein PsYK624_063110 [Phanerochaete sordida]